ncbi:unnamed protein product [[Candida] boidinii]|nr:unnamed protein product [[Candida] boidinii]
MKICHNCGTQELGRYPKLQTKLIEVVSELLRERLGPTTKYVESLIEIHRAYINTNHPNFVGAASAMASVVEERQRVKERQHVNKVNIVNNKPLNPFESNGKILESANGTIQPETAFVSNADSDLKPSTIASHEHTLAKANGNAADKSTANGENKDTFLKFFFGKEDSAFHQQQSQNNPGAEQRLDPFQFPLNNDTLEFHIQGQSPITKELERLDITRSESELSEREQLECELIRRLIISYFGIIREMIEDQVPKAIIIYV